MENLHSGKSKFHTHQWIKYTFLNLQLYLKVQTFYRTEMVLYFSYYVLLSETYTKSRKF